MSIQVWFSYLNPFSAGRLPKTRYQSEYTGSLTYRQHDYCIAFDTSARAGTSALALYYGSKGWDINV